MRILAACALLAGLAVAQGQRRPYIGYMCAAGGQQGTVVRIFIGGQNLRGAKRVLVSGAGVSGTVIKHERTPWLLKPDDRRVVAQQLRRLAQRRKRKATDPPALPDHPMLKNLESMSPRELRRIAYEFLDPQRRSQLSPQIAEVVEIEITIDADAALGEREFRLGTPRGLTNPVVFRVGAYPEYREREPNDYRTAVQPPVDTPCVFNGQVSFKDNDRFRFRGKKGEKLVIEAEARRLVPYLADAVPGWFQATLTLYDAKGNEIRYVDDHRFDPDPVIYFEVPQDGHYVVEIKDAIDRGREDFVYRITVAQRPYALTMFPLGGREGSVALATITGWNLTAKRVRLDTGPGTPRIRRTGALRYAVDDLPECTEASHRLALPTIVNGRIAKAGEVDRFRLSGRAGQTIVAEVNARRLGSPLDSLLQMTDEAGRVIAWNDDHHDKSAGLVTHQADSYLRTKLPADGTYFVRVADAQGHGGKAFAYRLRVSEPRPDYEVIVTPASVNVPAGGIAEVTLHAIRRDGFAGVIAVALPEEAKDLRLSGAWIPAGSDKVRMTVAATRRGQPRALDLRCRAVVDGATVERTAVPAEDMMQAFGLRHLVPAERWYVTVAGWGRRGGPMRLANARRVQIPAGGTAEARVLVRGVPPLAKMRFELDAPPDGITLKEVRAEPSGLVLVLRASRVAAPGLAGNVIVRVRVDVTPPPKDKKKARKREVTGLLPAVPFAVVADANQ